MGRALIVFDNLTMVATSMKVSLTLLLQIFFVLSLALVVCGIAGMFVCFLYLSSADIRDITGAGLGFVAGAVFVGSGLISAILSLLGLREKPKPDQTGKAPGETTRPDDEGPF